MDKKFCKRRNDDNVSAALLGLSCTVIGYIGFQAHIALPEGNLTRDFKSAVAKKLPTICKESRLLMVLYYCVGFGVIHRTPRICSLIWLHTDERAALCVFLLQIAVVQLDVLPNHTDVLVTEYLLQREQVTAVHEVQLGERVPERVRRDANASDACVFAMKTDAFVCLVVRQRLAIVQEKQVGRASLAEL